MSDEKIFQIGVMIGNVHTQHPMELIRGISKAAASENVNITFFVGAQGNALDFWNADENELSSYNYQYNTLYDYSQIAGLDALIISYGTLCIYLDKDNRESFAAKYRSVPLVILEEYDEASCDSFIISDNYASMYNIMEHLLSVHGYKKILYLSGPKNNTDSNERERAYRAAMSAYAYPVTEEMVEYGDYSSDVDDLVERLLDHNPGAEAIVAANDEMAVSVYRVLRSRGLTPGKDIAVTGYDDVDYAQRMDPPLTTANQDGLDMGYRALKCAVSLCRDPKPVKMKLPAKFLLRQSCGCMAEHASASWGLTDLLHRIENSSDKKAIKDAVTVAASDSFLSIATEAEKEHGKEYFTFLIDMLLPGIENGTAPRTGELMEKVLNKIKKLCGSDGMGTLDFSGFTRSFHQVMQYFMEKTRDPGLLVKIGRIMEITDAYLTSYVMRSSEDRIMMLQNKSWEAPSTILYMIEKVDDEKAFNRLALENVISQGAKRAYLYFLKKPLKCDRDTAFSCPDKLELVAEYDGDEVKVYGKKERPFITKKEGFASRYPSSPSHTYVAFIIFARAYQYGIMLCEIDAQSIGLLYSSALQISTAKSYMQINQREKEAKRQLCDTLKELKDKNQILGFVSSTDELTGLYNRRGFMENAVMQINSHTGLTAAIFFSDLDHLKQINDTFGHGDGDFALKNASAILKETVTAFGKESAVCGRTGGDEFVSFIILERESDKDKILKELKERCRKFNEASDKPYYVEFSTGCITFTCSDNYSFAELTGQADSCLYEAKKSRRKSVLKNGERT